MRPSVKKRCSVMEWGSLSQPAAWSLGVISVLQVSASVGIEVKAAFLDSPTGRAGASRRFAAGLFPPGSSQLTNHTQTRSDDKFLHAVLVQPQRGQNSHQSSYLNVGARVGFGAFLGVPRWWESAPTSISNQKQIGKKAEKNNGSLKPTAAGD